MGLGSQSVVSLVPGAADTALGPLVAGRTRPGSVVAVVADAVHLSIDDRLLVISGPRAVRLPGSVTVAQPLRDVLDLDRLDPALVGDDRVQVGDVAIEIRRWTAPPRPRLRNVAAAARRANEVAKLLPSLPPPVDHRAAVLHVALQGAGDIDVPAAVARLLGLGPGLTPAGDDVLAGAVLALHAAGNPAQGVLAAAIVAHRHRTTALSAALLDAAATGCCIPQLARFVAALDGRADLEAALAALLAVGSSSGAALASGIVVALTADDPVYGLIGSAA